MSQQGLLECLRYSLPPNALSYCGPNKIGDLLEYRKMRLTDQGLVENLSQFHTLYAYLSFIAYENDMRDPFDLPVVKAYWVGNKLLKQFDIRRFYYHLRDTLGLKKQLSSSELATLFGKLPQGALPNHAFHVLNVPWRTGHLPIEHTLETMDACRIGWGRVIKNEKLKIKIEKLPLVYDNEQLKLGKTIREDIVSNINGTKLVNVKKDDWVSFHWGMVCNKISLQEIQSLTYYTELAIKLANEDIRRREHFG